DFADLVFRTRDRARIQQHFDVVGADRGFQPIQQPLKLATGVALSLLDTVRQRGPWLVVPLDQERGVDHVLSMGLFPEAHPFANAFQRELGWDLRVAEEFERRPAAVNCKHHVEFFMAGAEPLPNALLERFAFTIGRSLEGVEAAAWTQKSRDVFDR